MAGSQEGLSGKERAASTGGSKKNQQQKGREQRKQDASAHAGDSEQKKSPSPPGLPGIAAATKNEPQQTQSLNSGLVGTTSSKGAKSAVDPALASGGLRLQHEASSESKKPGKKQDAEQNLSGSPKVPSAAQSAIEASHASSPSQAAAMSAHLPKKHQSMTPVHGSSKGGVPPDFLGGGKADASPATPLEKGSKPGAKGTPSSHKQDSAASKNSSKGGQPREIIHKYSPHDQDQSKSAQAELREKFTALQQAQSQN